MEAIIVVIGHTILDSLLSAFPTLLFCSTKTERNYQIVIIGCHNNLVVNNDLALLMVRLCTYFRSIAVYWRHKDSGRQSNIR